MVTDTFFDLQRFNVNDDAQKWADVATVGSATDTVKAHRSEAYDDFYDLDTGNAAAFVPAAYYNDEDATPTSSSSDSVIAISGRNYPDGTEVALADANHVTLAVGNIDSVPVPIHIGKNENTSVAVDVTIDLTGSSQQQTVAVGTEGNVVSANHEVSLGSGGGYVLFAGNAHGQNKVFAGSTGANIRHIGDDYRASIVGGAGADTILASASDIVTGGGNADLFYDSRNYAIQDYNAVEGDAIIATDFTNALTDINYTNIHSTLNAIQFGNAAAVTLGTDTDSQVYVKVAVADEDRNVMVGRRNIVLSGNNGLVDASIVDATAGSDGALIISDSLRGNSVHTIIGSAGNDTIYAGKNDLISVGTGNDYVYVNSSLGDGDGGAVVILSTGNGHNTVSGWTPGFDQNTGSTKLYIGAASPIGRFFEDRLFISLAGGSADDYILFDDTVNIKGTDATHGQYNVLIGRETTNEKFTAIRTGGYASVTSNDEIANYYIAESGDASVVFANTVTEDLGTILLGSENYYNINYLELNNNSHAAVLGSSGRETVIAGGHASVGATKFVSLGGDNDVIFSGGDDSVTAGHIYVFGVGDGRDTIAGFKHYRGVDEDPDKQYSDILHVAQYQGLKVEQNADRGYRIEFNTTSEDHVVLYEDSIDANRMYQVKIGEADIKLAKIGYSDTANPNIFEFDKKVHYYVGSSGEARDTLHVADSVENANIRLDGAVQNANDEYRYFRGISVVDASEETYTNISIGGSADSNTLIAGGEGTTNFLWGGGGDNSLVGGAGIDYFLYYKEANYLVAGGDTTAGGTHDTLQGYDENQDFIYLSNVRIEDINYAAMYQRGNWGISENAVVVDFNDGGSLTVNVASTNDKVSFWMQDGSVWSAERSTGAWKQEKAAGPLPS